jgi:hypothetical protein
LGNETPINPTADGIVFFRPQGIRDLDAQVASYKAVHTALQDVGGLAGVVVFGENMYGRIDEAIYIATKVKEFDDSIKTVLVDNHVDNFLEYEKGVFATPPSEKLQNEFGGGFSPIHMIASRDGVHFGVSDTFHEEAVERAKKLVADFVLAECFDGVIAGGPSNIDKEFQGLAGIEENDNPPDKSSLLRLSFKAKEALLKQLPALDDIENLVRDHANGATWDAFAAGLD